MRTIGYLLAMLLLATAVPTADVIANPYADRLARLDELRRHSALRRAIVDSGERCRGIVTSAQQGDYRNLAMWSARCAQGGDYALFLGPDGSVQVRPCADLRGLGLPTCRLPPQAARRP